MESASIDTGEKMEDEIKARFKAKGEKKDKKEVRGRGGKISRTEKGSCRRRTSFPGSVSVTGKRSVVCCSHIQVLM